MASGKYELQEVHTAEVWIILIRYRAVRKQTLADKIMNACLKLFYSFAVTFFIGKLAVYAAYLERGYHAYGGECLFIVLVFFLSLWAAGKIFNKRRETSWM